MRVELRIGRHHHLDGENLAGSELAGRDRLGVFDMFAGVDQESAGLFRESAVVGPAGDDVTGRVAEQDLDSLLARKIKFDGVVTAIGQEDVDRQLADLRELDRFERKFH